MAGLTEHLRVAYLVRSWPRLSQTFITDEVLALERLGVELTVFSLTRGDDRLVQPQVAQARARVHYIDEEHWAHTISAGRHLALAGAAPRRYLPTFGYAVRHAKLASGYANGTTADSLRAALHVAAHLRAARREGRPFHHLHAHFAHDPALVGLFAHRLTGLPFTFTAHARDLYQLPPASLAARAGAARVVVVCSQANADYLCDTLPGLDPARVRVIRHGVDVERFHPQPLPESDDSPLVLSVGRLVEKKGFDDLLRTCAHLAAVGVPFRCAVYGDGPLGGQLHALRDELGLVDRVGFHGERRQHELVPVFQHAHVFALAPYVTADGDRDGIPNVVAEAMACGVPVVATTTGAVGELVRHGETGLLAPPRRPDALAAQLATVLTDDRLRRRLGAAGRRAVETEFDSRVSARALLDVFTAATRESERR